MLGNSKISGSAAEAQSYEEEEKEEEEEDDDDDDDDDEEDEKGGRARETDGRGAVYTLSSW